MCHPLSDQLGGPRNKTKNKTKEEELCGKLLKKTPARKNRPFKPANSSAFYIGAHTLTHAGVYAQGRCDHALSDWIMFAATCSARAFIPS